MVIAKDQPSQLDTGRCERSSPGKTVSFTAAAVSTYALTLVIFSSIGRRSCEIIMKEKHHCHTKLCAFRCLISRPQLLNPRSRNQSRGQFTSFSKTTLLQREPFLKMLLSTSPYYITRYQVRFYINNYFE